MSWIKQAVKNRDMIDYLAIKSEGIFATIQQLDVNNNKSYSATYQGYSKKENVS